MEVIIITTFVYVCPSHDYVVGEWVVKRLSLSLSSEYLGKGQGYSWGLRLSQNKLINIKGV